MNQKVQKRVEEHAAYVELNIGHEIPIFTALQGSQNYQMDDEFSDVDTKTLVVPSFESLVFNKKRTSTTLEVAPTIEHADVKDWREMVNCWKKQNINFIEILFTPYVHYNLNYEWAYTALWVMREDIAHFNPYKAACAIHGNLVEKYRAFDHPYPSAMEKIKKFGYDPKQLSHMLRFKDFLIRYFKDESYEQCLIPSNREELIAIKRGSIPLEDARKIREETLEWSGKFMDNMRNKLKDKPNPKTVRELDMITYEVFEQAVRNRDYGNF